MGLDCMASELGEELEVHGSEPKGWNSLVGSPYGLRPLVGTDRLVARGGDGAQMHLDLDPERVCR